MVLESATELNAVSEELAAAISKPAATPQEPPSMYTLHPDLVALLSKGSLAITRQGLDMSKITAFTKDARSRGMRANLIIIGWHPRGTHWYAVPPHHGRKVEIIAIDRMNRLARTELDLEGFVSRCITEARAEIEEATKEPEKPVIKVPEGHVSPTGVVAPKLREIPVVLHENNGAIVESGDKQTELDAETWGYIVWCMRNLDMITEEPPPDLSRWVTRTLRTCRLDAAPSPGDPDYERYHSEWLRISHRSRGASGSVSHEIPSWKVIEPGSWVLGQTELGILRRNAKATPRRHRPAPEQRKTWMDFVALLDSDEVQLHIK